MPGMTPPPPLDPKSTPQPASPGFTVQQPSAGGFAPPPANGFAAPNAFSAAPPPVNQPVGVSMQQGTDFNPEAFKTDNTTDSGDPFEDIDRVLEEEEAEKKPLNKKMLLIVGAAVLAILAVIIIIVVVIANGGKGDDDETGGFDGNGAYIDEVTHGGNNAGVMEDQSLATLTPEEEAALAAAQNGGQPATPEFPGIESSSALASSSEPEEDNSFHYTPEEADALRAVGYTSHEIEEFEKAEEKDTAALIKVQEKAIRQKLTEEYQNMIKALQNATGDESQEFLRTTWYGYPVQQLKEDVKDELGMGETPQKVNRTENVDYAKIKLHGNQAWLRITLDNEDVVFMPVSPTRYVALEKESGNIVITYTETTYLDGRFYENIEEKKVT